MSPSASPRSPRPGRPRRHHHLLGVLAAATTLVVVLPAVASADEPGATNTITDVPGIQVGHETRTGGGYQTGTTVVLAEDEATASYTTFGGGPGTKETDLLEPGGLVTAVNAIVLSGGSAYGLDTTTGVMRWLEERGRGYPVGQGVVPIVPGAILFDLGRGGDFSARPDADFGYAAADAATGDAVEMGRVGAGTGASWGLGSASVVLDNGYTVGAIVGLNPGGSPVNPDNCLPYGAFLELGDEFPLREPNRGRCPALRPGASSSAAPAADAEEFNTTIAVVATDAPLDQTEAQRMSMIANSGLSRSIKPVHNLFDGDTVFAMATSEPGELSNGQLNGLYNAAADALGRAVVHALLEGETLGNRVAYCEQYPRMCEDRAATSAGGTDADGAAAPVADVRQPPAAPGTVTGTDPGTARSWAGPGGVAWTAIGLAVALAVVGLLARRRSHGPGIPA